MSTTDAKDTAGRLLDVAERLFGERGVGQVSLRDITGEAGANVAAVNYHFGSRQGLVDAVFNRRMEPLNEERIRLLDEIPQGAGESPPTLEAILRAFIGPTFRLNRAHPEYMQFLARLHVESVEVERRFIHAGRFPELIARMRAGLLRVFPDGPVGELWWGTNFIVGAMIHTWSKGLDMERLSGGEARYESDDRVIDRLVRFGASGLRELAAGNAEVES